MLEKLYKKAVILAVLGTFFCGFLQPVYAEEEENPGSESLSAGTCQICSGCTRPAGEPCRFPEKRRYSIESIGGNVGKTISKLCGVDLEWIEEGKLPDHFVLVGGLLIK